MGKISVGEGWWCRVVGEGGGGGVGGASGSRGGKHEREVWKKASEWWSRR